MNKFEINIGDWSDDGHGKVSTFLVSTAKSVDAAREAHFKIEEVSGVNIHSFVNEYEEGTIYSEDLYKLLQVPGFKKKFKKELEEQGHTEEKERLMKAIMEDEELPELEDFDEEDFKFGAWPRFMAELWVYLLNLVDKDLNLEIISKPDIPSLNFYGFDEKGRHIDFVGYGLFD